MKIREKESLEPTVNACKQCSPLGASFVFKGVANCVPLLHGSQGCSTYIRRYLIGHFREPVDIASTNFSEDSAIFGGRDNLFLALQNITKQYMPEVIGIATTCLSETIGDDVNLFIREYKEMYKDEQIPALVHASTPSYKGTHQDGFYATIKSIVDTLAEGGEKTEAINFIMNAFSPEDIRWFKELAEDFGIASVILPDYSDTLDGEQWTGYKRIPEGGTSLSDIRSMGRAAATFEFGDILDEEGGASDLLEEKFGVKKYGMGFPIGIDNTDYLLNALENITGKKMPAKLQKERGRLIDSYVDAHKYLFGKRVAIYGDDDLVTGIVSFVREVGMIPVICATGRKSGFFEQKIHKIVPDYKSLGISVHEDVDFDDIGELSRECDVELFIGNSKGYKIARELNVPLLRVGFPIQDRFGGQRIRLLGYKGTQELLDRIVNAIIEKKQADSPVGYMAM